VDTESLVLAAKQGDDEAFYMLIDENKALLYKIAFSYLKNDVDVLEAIQETTYKAYIKIQKLREPKYFKTWLIRILINHCLDEIKLRKRTVFSKVETISETDDYKKIGLEIAVENLQPKYRNVIILKYFHDLTIKDIAEILEKPESTIKTWLSKALLDLRKYFQKDGESSYV